MASLPDIYGGAMVCYPLTRSIRRGVQVLEYTDFTEQRWRQGSPLEGFTLVYSGLSKADMLTLRQFFDARKGGFDKTWDLTIGGETYPHMMFLDDAFEASEAAGGYAVSFNIRQVRV